MTTASIQTQAYPATAETGEDVGAAVYELPEGYDAIRTDTATQFTPLQIKPTEPRDPSWIERVLQRLFEWLAEILAPVGEAISSNWALVQWALVAALVVMVIYLILRLIGPLRRGSAASEQSDTDEPEWQPQREESLALLEDADRLAEEGRYDEAARLLLNRSVGHIAKVRPDWVEPSSTARELAALPKLSDSARRAFRIISAAVERSLFALKALSQEDWIKAREAYADFALARLEESDGHNVSDKGAPA